MNRAAVLFGGGAFALALFYGCGEPLAINPSSDAGPQATSEDAATASQPEGGDALADGGEDGADGAAVDAPDDTSAVEQLGTPKVVFVLRTAVLPATTPLDENSVAHAGRDGFDGRCRAEAKEAGLAGTFVAWMSMSTGNGANAIDRLSDGLSWYLPATGGAGPSADLVFPSKASVVAKGPKIGIARGADGMPVVPDPGDERVWTGTAPNGQYFAVRSCGDWQGSGASGEWGVFGGVGASFWTAGGVTGCTNPYRAICFQQ